LARYVEKYEEPIETYEVIGYDQEFDLGAFEFVAPEGYRNGHLIGVEGQPYEVNPSLVWLIRDDASARFYRIEREDGESHAEAVSRRVESGPADLHVWMENHGPLNIEGQDFSSLDDGSNSGQWGSSGGSGAGTVNLGVARPVAEQRIERDNSDVMWIRSDMVRESEYDGSRPVRYKIIQYRTDGDRAKVAYDADLDGTWDAWSELADPAKLRVAEGVK
jgi:hypothetical protein